MIIKCKRDWYRINDLFNGPISHALEDFKRVSHKDPQGTFYTTQNRVRTGAPFFREHRKKMINLIKTGILNNEYRILEAVPPANHILPVVQGEFDGVYATVTFLNEPMRTALQKSSTHISRLQLFGIIGLEYYGQLMDIVEMFPDHTIEFSIYNRAIGRLKKHLIIWEIRQY